MEAKKTAMTVEQYLAESRTWEVKHEWVNGQAWAMTGARPVHNVVATRIVRLLGNALESRRCEAVNSDQRIEVADGDSYVYADGLVVCGPFRFSERDALSLTNPRVIVEVLSPTTRDYDLGTKFDLYRRISGLQDILYVDPDEPHVIHHARTAEGWLRRDLHEGVVRLTGIEGVELALEAVYADLEAVRGEG